MAWFETATNLTDDADLIGRRRYGAIEVVEQRLVAIRFRPWPRMWSWPDLGPITNPYHRRRKDGKPRGDRCLLYFNQPWRSSNFLALRYVVSAAGTSFGTFRLAVRVLDEVARIKRTDAIVCDASNFRISDRLLQRWGWESHLPSRWHRHYIKRFYGSYPPPLELVDGYEIQRVRETETVSVA